MNELMVFNAVGAPLNATFGVEAVAGRITILWRGRWHKTHNRDYLPALELVLQRLGAIGARLVDALVETEYTKRHRLSEDECRLPIRGRTYPVDLESESDFHRLRIDLLSGIGRVGLRPGDAGGHTPLKQLRLVVSLRTQISEQALAHYLSHG